MWHTAQRTRELAPTEEWIAARRRRLTSSRFWLVHADKSDANPRATKWDYVARELGREGLGKHRTMWLQQLLAPRMPEEDQLKGTHGISLEPHVQALYETRFPACHVAEVGVCWCPPGGGPGQPDYSFLVASPDGYVVDHEREENGLLEIKTHGGRTVNMQEMYEEADLRREHPRLYYQVQGGMALARAVLQACAEQQRGQGGCPYKWEYGEVQWTDVVFWKSDKDVCVRRVPFDQAFWAGHLYPALADFYRLEVQPRYAERGIECDRSAAMAGGEE